MTKIDLSDFYMHLSTAEQDRKFFRFMFNGRKYECAVMPFGLAPAPCIATNFLQPAIKYLRRGGTDVWSTSTTSSSFLAARSSPSSTPRSQ